MSSNGALSPEELSVVETGVWEGYSYVAQLASGTANAYNAAKAASGGLLRIAPPDGGYRSLYVQADLWNQYNHLPHDYDHNLDPRSTQAPAKPGGSKHGFGLAVDMANTAANNWMWAHGSSFGFSHPFANDPQHWLHDGTTAIGPGTQQQQARMAPDMAVRLIWMQYLSTGGVNVYYRGYTGTGHVEDSLYSQDQANKAALVIGAATLTVNSAAELAALQTVLASLPA